MKKLAWLVVIMNYVLLAAELACICIMADKMQLIVTIACVTMLTVHAKDVWDVTYSLIK